MCLTTEEKVWVFWQNPMDSVHRIAKLGSTAVTCLNKVLHMNATEAIQKSIAEMEAKLTKLKALQDALSDEDVRKELEKAFGKNGDDRQLPIKPYIKRRKRRGTVYSKIAGLFRERQNSWLTLRELYDATHIPVGSLRNELYKQKADRFERDAQPGAGRETKFRMKSEYLAQDA